jgi:hypothetical protein
MKRLLLLSLVIAASVFPALAEDTTYAKRCLEQVETRIEQAKAHPDSPSWWSQCQIDLGTLKDAIAKLPAADRAPFDAKITLYTPQVEAGVKLDRGMHVARHIQDALADAKEDRANIGRISDAVTGRLDRYFAEPDAKGIPADQLKKLQDEYTALKSK